MTYRNLEGGGDEDVQQVEGAEETGFGEILAEWDASNNSSVLNASGNPCSNGEAVDRWVDLSGNGFDLLQPSDSLRPLYATNVLNSNPVVTFDGTDDFFHFPIGVFDLRDCVSVVIVYRTFAIEFFRLMTCFQLGGATASFSVGATGGDAQWIMDETMEGGLGTQKYSGALVTHAPDTWYGLICLSDYSQDSGGAWNKTQELIPLSAQDGYGWAGPQSVLGNFFGTYNDFGSGNLDGQVAHCIVYKTPLTETQRAGLFATLEAKWGTLA